MLLTGVLAAAPAPAQVFGGSAVTWSGDHMWRGLVRSSGQVLQGSVFAGVAYADWRVTAGYWTNLQLARGAQEAWSEIESGGIRFTEADPWVELGWLGETLDVRAGVAWYRYYGRGTAARRTAADNTHELYGRVTLPRVGLTPSAAVWHDPRRARGSFVEAGLIYALPLIPLYGNLDLVATSGISLGQQRNPADPDETSVSQRRGVTYVGLGVVANVAHPPFGAQLSLRLQLNTDGATRQVAPTRRRDLHAWLEATVSWSHGGGQ